MAKEYPGARQERGAQLTAMQSIAPLSLEQAVVRWQEACDAVAMAEARLARMQSSRFTGATIDWADLDVLRLHMTRCHEECLRRLDGA